MKQLSQVLPDMQNTVKEPSNALSVTPPAGSISLAGMIITPRSSTVSVERAKQGWEWLKQLKSYRTIKRKARWLPDQSGMEWVTFSHYTLPEGMTAEQAHKGLIEMLRPCHPTVTKHFVTLQAFKPFYEADVDRISIIYDGLYHDIQKMPEIAVVLALDELRTDKDEKFFPLHKILPAVEEWRNMIHECIDYFQQGEK